MKKSTIIIIILIYLASIVIINFFGMAIFSYDEVIYATKVECINQDMQPNSEGIKQVILNYSDGLTYRIEHKVYPENVSTKEITYIYDTNNKYLTINENGFASFNKPSRKISSFDIRLKTIDGTNLETTIRIIVVT